MGIRCIAVTYPTPFPFSPERTNAHIAWLMLVRCCRTILCQTSLIIQFTISPIHARDSTSLPSITTCS